jgi:ureidoglycolate lyase
MSLGDVSSVLVVDRDGPGDNLEEHIFETPYMIREPLL